MPDRAVDLIKHFEAHIIKYERERVVQRCCARWHDFMNLFLAISITGEQKLEKNVSPYYIVPDLRSDDTQALCIISHNQHELFFSNPDFFGSYFSVAF